MGKDRAGCAVHIISDGLRDAQSSQRDIWKTRTPLLSANELRVDHRELGAES